MPLGESRQGVSQPIFVYRASDPRRQSPAHAAARLRETKGRSRRWHLDSHANEHIRNGGRSGTLSGRLDPADIVTPEEGRRAAVRTVGSSLPHKIECDVHCSYRQFFGRSFEAK
jgi:hypothetical protein